MQTPKPFKPISIRVSPHPYLGAGFLLAFTTAFLLYLGLDNVAYPIGIGAAVILPVLAFTDRIKFDRRRLIRTGIPSRLLRRFAGVPNVLRVNHIEQAETQAIRAFKRNGRVIYAYRTTLHGRAVSLTFATGGDRYIELIKALFPLLPEDAMDNRSIELRDFYINHREAQHIAEQSNVPSAEVLEQMMQDSRTKRPYFENVEKVPEKDRTGKYDELRRLANQLRVNGALLQAAEVFRRALLLGPRDAWLLFEFAKCLYSFGISERDRRMERRAVAMLRLAERRAGNDAELLSRIGESYFQIGDWSRSRAVFRRVREELGETFRSLRGSAELALREGKIAHVIHNFSAASEIAKSPALKRWTEREVAYFSRLSNDEEYMELEVSRVNLVERLLSGKRSALRVAAAGFPLIAAGLLIEWQLVTNIGWAISILGVAVWTITNLMVMMLWSRIPLEMVESDD